MPGPSHDIRATRAIWVLATLDVMTISWMLAAGEWFDRASPITSPATLGGRHELVLWLAVAGLAMMLAAALLSSALVPAHRCSRVLVTAGAAVSLLAIGGLLSVAAVVLGVGWLAAQLGRSRVR